MKRLVPIFAMAVPMLLAGCGEKSVNARNASVAEVAEMTKDTVKLQAGEWVMNTEVIDMAMPGMNNPEILRVMKEQMAKQKITTSTTCFTKDDVERPPARFFAGDASANCKYDHFTMGGGKIDAVLACGAAGPDDVQRHTTMKMAGSFSSGAMDLVTEVSAGSGAAAMTMKAHVQGKRVGECAGEKDKEK